MLTCLSVSGGPGTRKGKIVDNLSNVFGFEVINMEKLMIENLTKKLEEPDPNQTIQQIQHKLKVSFLLGMFVMISRSSLIMD